MTIFASGHFLKRAFIKLFFFLSSHLQVCTHITFPGILAAAPATVGEKYGAIFFANRVFPVKRKQ